MEFGSRMLLEDANRACPDLGLTSADVVGRQWSRLPLEAGGDGRPGTLADRALVTGSRQLGLVNLHGVETVKYEVRLAGAGLETGAEAVA